MSRVFDRDWRKSRPKPLPAWATRLVEAALVFVVTLAIALSY